MRDKDALILENLYNSINEIHNPNPAENEVNMGKILKPNQSGFCIHNPKINQFAQANSTQMFIVFAFVYFTIQKEWQNVIAVFPEFIEWIFEEAIPNDNFEYSHKPFAKIGGMYGASKTEDKMATTKEGKPLYSRLFSGSEARYVAKVWERKNEIYDFVMSNKENPGNIYMYIIQNIPGLGVVKAAFTTQLILGQFGCIDSINTKIYKNLISKHPDAFAFDKKTNSYAPKDSMKGIKGYLDFLDALEQMYQEKISKILWDDWCEVVDRKVVVANGIGEKQKIIINFPNNEPSVTIDPYKIKSHTAGYMKDLEKDIKASKDPRGHIVSKGHMDAVTDPKFSKYIKAHESFDSESVINQIKILKESLLNIQDK
jgi:hypothetical protein